MAQADMPFSSDEAFNELTDKDKTVELFCYICSVKAAATVGEGGRYKLLKFSLTNGTRKVQCCIWGQTLIEQYQADIVMYKKVHIDGAHCKISRLSYIMENEGYVPFDITIQASTVVTFVGMFELTQAVQAAELPQEVTFENISDAQGLISIDGFIKMRFSAISSRFESATYGCGSITDGTFKITVNITNFVPNENYQKGVPVKVIGNINYDNGTLCITCNNMSCISIRENIASMPDVQLMQAGRTLRRRLPAE